MDDYEYGGNKNSIILLPIHPGGTKGEGGGNDGTAPDKKRFSSSSVSTIRTKNGEPRK